MCSREGAKSGSRHPIASSAELELGSNSKLPLATIEPINVNGVGELVPAPKVYPARHETQMPPPQTPMRAHANTHTHTHKTYAKKR